MAAVGSTASAQAAGRRHLGRLRRQTGAGYAFLVPWLVGFFCLTLGPLLGSLYLSFTRYDLFGAPRWVGVANYMRLAFDDPKYWDSLEVTFIYVTLSVPLKLLLALLIASTMNKGLRGLPIYRAIFYLPSLLGASVAISILWRQLFAVDGVVNTLLAAVGVHGQGWVTNPDTALYTLVLLSVWQFGSPMIIFLAGLRQIPRDLYEAAELDGASGWRQFMQITLPLLTPVLFFNLVVQAIDAFKAFTPAYVVSGGTGGPVDSTLFYTLYLFQQGFTYFRMGYAAAIAWVLVLIIAAFTALTFLSAKAWVVYDD